LFVVIIVPADAKNEKRAKSTRSSKMKLTPRCSHVGSRSLVLFISSVVQPSQAVPPRPAAHPDLLGEDVHLLPRLAVRAFPRRRDARQLPPRRRGRRA
jgi:hypothetical protein